MDNETRNLVQYQLCLKAIKNHYGTDCAKRSKVLLMSHVEEGVSILMAVQGNFFTKEQAAFAIHPLIQNNVEFNSRGIDKEIINLAQEYAFVANSYLCRPSTDFIKNQSDLAMYFHDEEIEMSLGCALMLYADKVQNKKDFMLHHWGKHKRSSELLRYFNTWINYLKLRYAFDSAL